MEVTALPPQINLWVSEPNDFMKRTWLIQRLNKPNNIFKKMGFKSNPFEFGGGYLRGGLDEKAYDMLNQFISFEYMGSSEFEWGALPDALRNILDYIKKRDYANGLIKHNGKDIYVLCKESEKQKVSEIIGQLLKDERQLHLKELCGLKDALEGKKEYVGWIELDNGFMFFIDKTTYNGVMGLMGLDASNILGQGVL